MNRNKLKIVVLLLVFLLVLVLFALHYLENGSERVPNPSESSTTVQTTEKQPVPVTPIPTASSETTAVTTEATTEPTTVPTTVETTVATETTEVISGDIGLQAAKAAAAQVGKPYQYGSAGPDAFDTSGLAQYCYKQCGISIPRSNSALASHGHIVEKEKILPGDAVFFWSDKPGTAEYLGVYIGNGMVVAALNSSKPVVQFDMNSSYYTEHFVFARRFY